MGCQYFHRASFCPCTLLFRQNILSWGERSSHAKPSLNDRLQMHHWVPATVQSIVLAGIASTWRSQSVARDRNEGGKRLTVPVIPPHCHQGLKSSREHSFMKCSHCSQPPQTAQATLWGGTTICKATPSKVARTSLTIRLAINLVECVKSLRTPHSYGPCTMLSKTCWYKILRAKCRKIRPCSTTESTTSRKWNEPVKIWR